MARQPSITDLVGLIKGIMRRLEKLETAARLGNASVGAGGLRFYDGGTATFEDGGGIDVRDGGSVKVSGSGGVQVSGGGNVEVLDDGTLLVYSASGQIIARVGQVEPGVRGMRYFRVDGTRSLDIRDQDSGDGTGTLIIYDQDENALVWDDSRAGFGLGGPTLAVPLYPYKETSMESTSSGSFVPLWSGYIRKWSRYVNARLGAYAAAGVTGEMRLLISGTQVGPTLNVPGGGYTATTIQEPMPGGTTDYGFLKYVEVQARLTGGAGPVYVVPEYVETLPQPA